MSLSHHARKRVLAATAAIAVVSAVVTVAVLSDASLDAGSTSGTMAGSSALDVVDAGFAWSGASSGTLLSDFEVSVDLQSSRTLQSAVFELFFSRDAEFDSGQDCRVQSRTVSGSSGGDVSVQFRGAGYEAPCLDAGSWFAAVRVVETGQWIPLANKVTIEGGEADLELVRSSTDLGWDEPLVLAVDVHRQTGDAGLDGLFEHPVQVWMSREDQVCLLRTDGITLPRDPARRIGGTSVATRVEIVVKTDGAKRVERGGSLAGLVSGQQAVPPASGACRVGEGEWLVAVGPDSEGTLKTAKVTVHSRPATIDSAPVAVTLSAGEARSIGVGAFNPSVRAVGWTASPDGLSSEGWLVGLTGQRLAPKDSTEMLLTVSAVDLQPGFYTGTFRVALQDYYRTEVRIPVELTVLQQRRAVQEANGDLPGTFEAGNYPNPFNGRTTIRMQLVESGQVRVAVYDVAGREVCLVVDEWMDAGMHEVPFEADQLPSGTYLYRVSTGSGSLSRTMTLVN